MQRSSSCSWVRGLVGMFGAQGLDGHNLLLAAGVAPERLDDPAQRFGVDEVSRLWEQAVQASANPALGLDRDLAARYGNLDSLAFSMLACAHLRSALEQFSSHLAVVSDAASFALEPGPQGGVWLALGGLGNTAPVPRQRYAYGLLTLLGVCDWLIRRTVCPLAVEFRFAVPPDAAAYPEIFGCVVRFAQSENRILLRSEDLETPLPSRNAQMLAMHESVLQTQLRHLGATTVSAKVCTLLARQLHQGEPLRELVARSLAMSDRTLQRRLAAENTSFAALLDATRRELACKYLSEDCRPLNDVAELLGFHDLSNLSRACRRWFGISPALYRQRVLHAAQPNALGQEIE